ncbi:hypothetical protein PQX77_009923 [Marasmius sp. AFHP31]|nr:hypothetical protein PQX77_009923 [Marasmius sp. AFHP31]
MALLAGGCVCSPDFLREDVVEMSKVGPSGSGLLSYRSYGGLQINIGDVILDPTNVAFGSDTFVNAAGTLVRAAKDNGVTIDFTLAPNQGAQCWRSAGQAGRR